MKSGIYKIISKQNSKTYIGSAVNLSRRFSIHKRDLKNTTHHSKPLQNHVNKYGLDDLIFLVVEYVKIDDLISREQYYLDNENPKFNVCKVAGTCLGIKHDTSKTKHQKGENKPNSKLKESDIFEIRELIKNKVKFDLIQKKYKVSKDLLHGIKSGTYWKYLNLKPIKISRASKMTLERILEVKTLISNGKSSKEISKELKISVNTIRKIKNNEYQELENIIREQLS